MKKIHLYLLLAAVSLAWISYACTKNCLPVEGLDTFLNPGQVILLGEIHGTEEAPHYVRQIACNALQKDLVVTVGLELPEDEESIIHDYLNSKGKKEDVQKVLGLPFWSQDYQDGRASQAMFHLIESIRIMKSLNKKIHLISIDNPGADDRDIAMAENVIEEAEENVKNFMVILTGNYHNMIWEDAGHMGTYVLDKLGSKRVLSLNQNYVGGTAWVDVAGEGFGPIGLRGNGTGQIGIIIDTTLGNYHGSFEMDKIHYSPPAKDFLNK